MPISIANSDISNMQIQVFNNGLVSIATRYNADYINLYSLYEFNGGLNPLYTSDGTHLKTDAYQLWYDEVSKFF